MTQARIPVDLLNPGQVFACLGLLEAADALLGDAKGGFDWTHTDDCGFELCARGTANPVEAVLEFFVEANCERLVPERYEETAQQQPKSKPAKDQRVKHKRAKEKNAGEASKHRSNEVAEGNDAAQQAPGQESTDDVALHRTSTFPAKEVDEKTLPLRFVRNGSVVHVSHFCDASSRRDFKLYAGQQRSAAIARDLREEIRRLWNDCKSDLVRDPLGLTVPLGGGSFKFDARKAWTTIDAGYSPNEQKHLVQASPVVELLAAVGLEHARPHLYDNSNVRYGAWKGLLPPMLARPALAGVHVGVPLRIFRFVLDSAGKNKVVTFAREETDR